MNNTLEPSRGYEVPDEANKISEDFPRLRVALTKVGADVAALFAGLAGKADLVHSHVIGGVTGLQAALDGKAAAGHTHSLDDLSDVTTAGATDFQVLARIGGSWQPWAINLANISGLAGTYVVQSGANGAAVLPVGTTAQRPGSAVSGMIRRNSELAQWEGFDGVGWAAITGATTIRVNGSAVATAGQTSFPVAGGYTPGAVEVYRNGVRLTPSAYTATDGANIVLGTPAAAGDAIAWLGFSSFTVADTLRRALNLADLPSPEFARQNLGATVTGSAVFTAANQAAARTAIGMTAAGSDMATAANVGAQRALLGQQFSASWVSAEQAITNGGALTLAHTLGMAPKLVQCFVICKTASDGFAVGKILPVGTIFPWQGVGWFGATPDVDSTSQITVQIGNSGILVHNSSGTGLALTNANWRLIVRAYA